MHFIRLAVLACIMLPGAALAADTPKSGLSRLNSCLSRNVNTCQDYITASSVPLYNRFLKHGLSDCLPRNVAFVSQKPAGDHMLVRSRFSQGGQDRIARLLFVREENQWKLDVPETLRAGIGENWENQLNSAEQILLLLKQQTGAELNCTALQSLVQSKS